MKINARETLACLWETESDGDRRAGSIAWPEELDVMALGSEGFAVLRLLEEPEFPWVFVCFCIMRSEVGREEKVVDEEAVWKPSPWEKFAAPGRQVAE